MNKTHKIKGTLKIIKRLKGSYYGNPRYQVEIGEPEIKINGNTFRVETVFETEENAGLAYGITNFDGKEVNAEVRYLKNKNIISHIEGD